MDEYGVMRPESFDWAADLASVAEELRHGQTVYVVVAAGGARYGLVLVDTEWLTVPDNGRRPEGVGRGPFLLVVAEGHGSYWLRADLSSDPGYVYDRLRLPGIIDAEIVAGFLTDLSKARGWG